MQLQETTNATLQGIDKVHEHMQNNKLLNQDAYVKDKQQKQMRNNS